MLIISWMRGVVGPDETLRASSLIVLTILLSSVDCTATKIVCVSEDASRRG